MEHSSQELLMNRLIATGVLSVCVTIGCTLPKEAPSYPTLEEVSDEGDVALDLVDRSAELSGSANADVASQGVALDLANSSDGFRLNVNADDVKSLNSSEAPPPTWANVVQGVAMATFADLITLAVIAPPSTAIGITANGTITQDPEYPNVWYATNSVDINNVNVDGTFTVAWVGTGWLAEMRITSADGTYDNTKWFSGYVNNQGTLGWWDFYDVNGTHAGVVEWISDGEGNGEFGFGVTLGEHAGKSITYWSLDGEALISSDDINDASQHAHVYAAADKSGEVVAPDFNGGLPACWAAEAAEFAFEDVPCPEVEE